jgi:RNA polymerase sigma factor (sigma-70 family)
MVTATASPVVRHVRCLAAAGDRSTSDAQLLHRFCRGRDQAAFEAIVRRYGRLVLGVCRHVLGHAQDAEDAFQATFLTLARRADSVRNPGALSAWLHGVAYHTALHARRDAARRRARERTVRPVPPVKSPGEPSLCEIQALLDAEVQRLPEPYRTVFVVCVLESRGTAEAAAQLGWKPGTVSGRLTRARQMLLRRLARHGVTLSAALTAAALEPLSARAAVPPALLAAAVRTAMTGVSSGAVLAAPAVRFGATLAVALATGLIAAALGTGFSLSSEPPPEAPRVAESPPAVAGAANGAGAWKGIENTLKKEPAYKTKPRYCLLAFGADGKDRVWLVDDGDTLYVDRNGNGDLTEPGKKVVGEYHEVGGYYQFLLGELRIGGRVHKHLEVVARLLTQSHSSVENRANARAALAADPKARAYSITVELDWPGMKGKGIGGRPMLLAGPVDEGGALLFADRPADAPVIHFGGPLKVTFEAEPPKLKLDWKNTAILVVGTPGRGAGTLAMLPYDGTIPDSVLPVLDAVFPPAREGEPSVQQRYELKERCCHVNLYGAVPVPPSAGPGPATVTLSLPWKGVEIAPTTHALSVVRRADKAEPLSPRFIRSLPHPESRADMAVVRFSPDGARLLAAGHPWLSGPGVLQFWDVASGKELCQVRSPGSRHAVRQAELPADWSALYLPFEKSKATEIEEKGKRTWQFDLDAAVLVYDPATGQSRPPLKLAPGQGLVHTAVSPDGRKLVTVEQPSYRLSDQPQRATVLWDTAAVTSRTVCRAGANAAFSADSRYFALSCFRQGSSAGELKLFDSAGNELAVLSAVKDGLFDSLEFSPDGRLLLARQHKKSSEPNQPRATIRVWDLTTRKEVTTFPAVDGTFFLDFAFSRDGRQLAAVDSTPTARVWDTATGKVILQKTFSDKLSTPHAAFAPDGKRLAVAAGPRVRRDDSPDYTPDPQDLVQPRVFLFDLANPSAEPEVAVCPHGLAGGLAWSPDGKMLAVGGSGAVHLLDMTPRK